MTAFESNKERGVLGFYRKDSSVMIGSDISAIVPNHQARWPHYTHSELCDKPEEISDDNNV